MENLQFAEEKFGRRIHKTKKGLTNLTKRSKQLKINKSYCICGSVTTKTYIRLVSLQQKQTNQGNVMIFRY
jgi:hypothetical protein